MGLGGRGFLFAFSVKTLLDTETMNRIVKLYTTSSRKIMVSYVDPIRRNRAGQKKRVVKWFRIEHRAQAQAYQRELERRLLEEGAQAVANQTQLREDAKAARALLDGAGLKAVSLAEAARSWLRQAAQGGSGAAQPCEAQGGSILFSEAVAEFLEYMIRVAEARPRTVANLRARLGLWARVAGLQRMDDVGRGAVLALRDRGGRFGSRGQGPVSRQTRVNDLLAASAFCSWAVEMGWLAFNPVSGVRRPDAGKDRARPCVWSGEQLARLLEAARGYQGGRYLPVLIAMNFIGAARPSEVTGVQIRYERDEAGAVVGGMARVEGGKMRGRADRNVELLPVALAWLARARWPQQCEPLTVRARREICAAAGGLSWGPDICRHTCISHLVQLRKNDAAVARECGTSEEVIFSRYHNLRSPRELEEWMGLRPEGQGEGKQLMFPISKEALRSGRGGEGLWHCPRSLG